MTNMTISANPVDRSLVRDCITSAKRRLADLLVLGDRISAMHQERQQSIREFFWHAVATVDMLAQLVNQGRGLGKSLVDVSAPKLLQQLPTSDPILPLFRRLYANPRKDPIPADLCSEAGHIWRLWNYRHQVSHRGRNPFLFQVGSGPAGGGVLC